MVIKECYRILRPKGALIVNTCSGEQLLTVWFLNLIPKACEKATKRLVNSNIQSHLKILHKLTNEVVHISVTVCARAKGRIALNSPRGRDCENVIRTS